MIELTQEELKQRFNDKIFGQISETADALGLECYVVGGYVRDIFLERPSKDIDVVVVGSGIEMAQALGKHLGKGAHVALFKNFGTAQVKYHGIEVEFVGARKESYPVAYTHLDVYKRQVLCTVFSNFLFILFCRTIRI